MNYGLAFTMSAAIEQAKANGASEYVYVEVGPVIGCGMEAAREKGEAARKIVDERWPGALLDPFASDYKTGRLALLLPRNQEHGS